MISACARFWRSPQSASGFVMVDCLHVSEVLPLVRTCRALGQALHLECIDSMHASLWDTACLLELPFNVLRARNEGLMLCLNTVRSDPRYSFHVHYFGALAECGLTERDSSKLDSVGSLKNWRPGDPRPSREDDEVKGLGIDDSYTADFEVHVLPASEHVAIHPKATRASRGCHDSNDSGNDAGTFFDIEYGIGLVCARSPSDSLRGCGAVKAVHPALNPALVWLFQADYGLVGPGDSVFILGCFDAGSDNFVLASFHEQYFRMEDPPELVQSVLVRHKKWNDMARLVERCWKSAGIMNRDNLPSCFRPLADTDLRSPWEMRSDQFHEPLRFQAALHKFAVNEVGVKRVLNNDGEEVWAWKDPQGVEEEQKFWSMDSTEWISRGTWAISPMGDGVDGLPCALADATQLVRQRIGSRSYAELTQSIENEPDAIALKECILRLRQLVGPVRAWEHVADIAQSFGDSPHLSQAMS